MPKEALPAKPFWLQLEQQAIGSYKARVLQSSEGGSSKNSTINISIDSAKLDRLTKPNDHPDWDEWIDPKNDKEDRSSQVILQKLELQKEIGGILFEAFLGNSNSNEPNFAALWNQNLGDLSTGESLRLKVEVVSTNESGQNTSLPWELLYDKQRNRFLALDTDTPLNRFLLDYGDRKDGWLIEPPLNILAVLVGASESDSNPAIEIENEWKALQESLQELVKNQIVCLERLERPVTIERLSNRLLEHDKPVHLIHFVGHGRTGGLDFYDNYWDVNTVDEDPLMAALESHKKNLRLIVLNACKGARSDTVESIPGSGVAQALLKRKIVPAVIAMQNDISQDAAKELTTNFYYALANGHPIDLALTAARKSLHASFKLEWWTPVLFGAIDDYRFFDGRDLLPKPQCPYPDMVAFREKQGHFFGREAEIKSAIDELEAKQFLTIIGPSGSGKSSLILAGIIPELRKSKRFGTGKWNVKTLQALSTLADTFQSTPKQPTLLVVDQFEKLFSTAEASEVQNFLDTLNACIGGSPDNLYIILSVRSDFYPKLEKLSIWASICTNRLELRPLDDKMLRAAILRPAAQVEVTIDDALVERLVVEAAGEPGAVPLVQKALVRLWDEVKHRQLLLSTYSNTANGKLPGLNVHAHKVYRNLKPEGKKIALRIFLRLVNFENSGNHTGRSLTEDELRSEGEDRDCFDAAIEKLANSRLLTLGGSEGNASWQVQISHNALIGGWQELGNWIERYEKSEQIRRRQEVNAVEWQSLGSSDSDAVMDKTKLGDAQRWLTNPDCSIIGITPLFAHYYKVCLAHILVERSLVLAKTQRDVALLVAIEALRAEPTLEARSNLLSMLGDDIQLDPLYLEQVSPGHDGGVNFVAFAPDDAFFATAGYTDKAIRLWNKDTAKPIGEPWLGHYLSIMMIAFSSDSQLVASAGYDKSIILWNVAKRTERFRLFGHTTPVWSIAFGANNTTLASGSTDGTIICWNLDAWLNPEDWASKGIRDSNRKPPIRFLSGHTDQVWSITFSRDGQLMASGSHDHTVLLWNTETWQLSGDPLREHEAEVLCVAFSPDGQKLAAGSGDGSIIVWNINDRNILFHQLKAHSGPVAWVTFSPNGYLASSGQDRAVAIWDITEKKEVNRLNGHTDKVVSLAFDKEGTILLSASSDGSVLIWDTATWAIKKQLVQRTARATSVVFTPDGQLLVAGSSTGDVNVWNSNTEKWEEL